MKALVKCPVLLMGVAYFFYLINPWGWTMMIHMAPLYMIIVVVILHNNSWKVRINRLCYPFLFYTLYTIFSIVFIANLDGTNGKVIRCIYELLILIVISSYNFDKQDINFIVKCMIITCHLITIKMIFQGAVLVDDPNRHVISNFGATMDPNYLAAAYIFPIIYVFDRVLNRNRRIVELINLCFLVIGVVMIGSRGAILSILIGVLMGYLMGKHSTKHIAMGLIGVCLIIVIYSLLPSYFAGRYSFASLHNDNGSNYLRFNLWKTCFAIFLTNPIWGRGGNSMQNFGPEYGAYKNLLAHSTYLDTLADYGLIGGLLFFLFLLLIVKMSFNSRNSLTFGVMCGTLVCSIFISAEHSAFFWQNIIVCLILNKEKEMETYFMHLIHDGYATSLL
ncbi:O-antigen ligase family protein [Pseudobutyrivibrio xylanivorans]|uniref:O-antigen ligase family protein n=1 Tax=Pseudobutyrivibrio xylanivorans TaxID=185007 RepID=A0A5P6VTV9_PSEXY|nr:O-antigen ligase family protein [Pseudobutyrivibrio xylanivorans]QFJ55860.1 O-antigen ligase family protein [Pseudobutyrivibrio xylanivorans]